MPARINSGAVQFTENRILQIDAHRSQGSNHPEDRILRLRRPGWGQRAEEEAKGNNAADEFFHCLVTACQRP